MASSVRVHDLVGIPGVQSESFFLVSQNNTVFSFGLKKESPSMTAELLGKWPQLTDSERMASQHKQNKVKFLLPVEAHSYYSYLNAYPNQQCPT